MGFLIKSRSTSSLAKRITKYEDTVTAMKYADGFVTLHVCMSERKTNSRLRNEPEVKSHETSSTATKEREGKQGTHSLQINQISLLVKENVRRCSTLPLSLTTRETQQELLRAFSMIVVFTKLMKILCVYPCYACFDKNDSNHFDTFSI